MGCGGSKQDVNTRASTPQVVQSTSRPPTARSTRSNKSIKSNKSTTPSRKSEPKPTSVNGDTVRNGTTSVAPPRANSIQGEEDDDLEDILKPMTPAQTSERAKSTPPVEDMDDFGPPRSETKSRSGDWILPPDSPELEEPLQKSEEPKTGEVLDTIPSPGKGFFDTDEDDDGFKLPNDEVTREHQGELGVSDQTLPPGIESFDDGIEDQPPNFDTEGDNWEPPKQDQQEQTQDEQKEKKSDENLGSAADMNIAEVTDEAMGGSVTNLNTQEQTNTMTPGSPTDVNAPGSTTDVNAPGSIADVNAPGSATDVNAAEPNDNVTSSSATELNATAQNDEAIGSSVTNVNTQEQTNEEAEELDKNRIDNAEQEVGSKEVIDREEQENTERLEKDSLKEFETGEKTSQDNSNEQNQFENAENQEDSQENDTQKENVDKTDSIENGSLQESEPREHSEKENTDDVEPGNVDEEQDRAESDERAMVQDIETGEEIIEDDIEGHKDTQDGEQLREVLSMDGTKDEENTPGNDTEQADGDIAKDEDVTKETDQEEENQLNNNEPMDDALLAVNTFSNDTALPEEQPNGVEAGVHCIRGFARSRWPVRCYVDLTEFNINAGYGGCAALLLMSCSYNTAENSTTEVALLRSGFDRNHFQATRLTAFHGGHFGSSYGICTDENGHLLCDCLFGHNYITILSNDRRHGNGLFGIAIDTGDGESFELPFNVNGGNGGGTSLIMCSAELPGAGDTEVVSCIYVVRSGVDSNIYQIKKLSENGSDAWKFEVNRHGQLVILGPSRSKVAIFHNCTDAGIMKDTDASTAAVVHRQTFRGNEETVLFDSTPTHGLMLVLCSSSSGRENNTTAAVYMVTLSGSDGPESTVKSEFVNGSTSLDSADVWTFSGKGSNLVVTGPYGPCKYAVYSNIPASDEDKNDFVFGCLATGSDEPIRGSVRTDMDAVTGWVSVKVGISITVNEVQVARYKEDQLVAAEDGKWAFQRPWNDDEKTPGYYVVRVFAVTTDADGNSQPIELSGSPNELVRQPKGVIFAVNCGGRTYQALNDIVYESEHKYYKNYGLESQSKALGGIKHPAVLYQLLTNTHDGFIHGSARSTGVEAEAEQRLTYQVPNVPNGEYKLRLHFHNPSSPHCIIQGQNRSEEVQAQLKATKKTLPGYTACQATIPISIDSGELDMELTSIMLCAFVLLESTYQDPVHGDEYIEWEKQEKQRITDSADPLPRSLTRKTIEITGWSQNLLENASAEKGTMSSWNYSGDWKIQEGGYQTERAFVSSHMWCSKNQTVDLQTFFSEEYLDTAPEIQVLEWYHEGGCGGGFYKFEATLLDADGGVVKRYESGQIGTIYTSKWDKQEAIFRDYGPGVRYVCLESAGKDDKHWGGHYGSICAAACIRVKSEVVPAEGDAFEDIDLSTRDATTNDKLVRQLLLDNADVIADGAEEGIVQEQDLNDLRLAETVITAVLPKTNMQQFKKITKKREIRVFVSSTFRDFTREREYLIKKTFRELNRLCADRHVFFTYVDLRWGVTKEQTFDGQTIAICLREIDRCRPYFICLMGDRYGWSQRQGEEDELLNSTFQFAIDTYKEFEWLEKYRYDSSITKLEILHGAFMNPGNKDRQFFYLRAPTEELDYIVDHEDIKICSSESDWHHERQYELRRDVEGSDFNTRTFQSPEEVCGKIKKDLEACINEDFPVGTEATALEREREAHMAFAEARRRVYIGRQEYFDEIQNYMSKENKVPLVILGESGSGKSALVANWVGRYEEENPDAFVFVHFIGSSAESASHVKLLRRLFEELKKVFGFDMAVPSSDSHLVRDFGTWLRLAGSRGKVMIVLDALNQLDSGASGEEQDLLWIPSQLPVGVQMLLSTLPGRSLDAVTMANWPTFRVEALQPSEKETIITEYLEGIYRKTLTSEQKQLIVEAPQTNNPLFLRASLDELRVFGEFFTLDERIKNLMSADDPGVLFGKILERLEQDFEQGEGAYVRENLVRDTTVAIWCSHRGMSEEELLEMLDIPSAVWSPFFMSLDENLINRNGIWNFFHDHLRQAVEARYLPTQEDKEKQYLKLADFFESRPITDRVVDELPFLLGQANDLDRLRVTITNLDVFRCLMKTEEGKFSLIKSWKMLGDYSQVEAAYLESLEEYQKTLSGSSSESFVQLLQYLAEFYMEIGLLNGARSLYEKLLVELESISLESHGTLVLNVKNYSMKHRSKYPHLIDVLHKLGKVCEKQGDLTKANLYFRDALDRNNKVETPKQKLQLVEGLLGLGSVLNLQGERAEAKKVFVRASEVAIDALGPTHHYVSAITGQVGKLCYQQGRVDEAVGFFLRDLKMTRGHVGTNHPRTAGIMNNIALVYDVKNDNQAGTLYEAALAILLETYGPAHLDVAHVRHNLGAFYLGKNYLCRAKYQFQEAIKIYEAFLDTDRSDDILKETQQALNEVTSLSN